MDTAAPIAAVAFNARETPKAGDTLYEIGVLLAVHFAFAFAVLLILRTFGVS